MVWRIMSDVFKAPLGFGNYSLLMYFNCLSEQGVGDLKGCIGLRTLQPAPCPSRSCVGGEGHGHLVYTVSIPGL